jgi:transposase
MNHALMLVGWDVTGVKVTGNVQEATATYNSLLDACPKCGSVGRLYRHGVKEIEYIDAPAFGKQFVICCRVQRFRCRDCGETSMQPLPDIDTQRRMTKRCVRYIEEQGTMRTYAEVARSIGVDEKTVRNICNGAFDRMMSELEFKTPLIMGIDELTLGGRKRTIFVDIGGKRLLDIIDAMNRGKVDRWLYRMPNKERVMRVAIDMWGPYRESVKAILPNAVVVVDKWHVLSKLNMALDRVRNRVRRASGIRKNPQKGRRLLQTSRHHLSPARRMLVDAIIGNSPVIDAAWNAKETFYDIWDVRPRADAEAAFDRWAASIPGCIEVEFRPIAQMVQNWREEIFAFFDYPVTNAYTEARNGLIKIANRAGRGYSFETIRAKALLMKSGPYKTCDCCSGEFPKSSFKTLELRYWVDGKIYPMDMCTNCHFAFHIVPQEIKDAMWHTLSTLESG